MHKKEACKRRSLVAGKLVGSICIVYACQLYVGEPAENFKLDLQPNEASKCKSDKIFDVRGFEAGRAGEPTKSLEPSH